MTRVAAHLSLVLLLACTLSERVGSASRVFLNGAVYTVNEHQPWATAVAIRDDEIEFVGSDEDVQAYIGKDTVVTDLEGKMLLPGFQDSHLHLSWGGMAITACNLSEAVDPEAVQSTLLSCAEKPGRGADNWVQATIWQRSAFPEGIPPSGFLDELFPHRPVSVEADDGHSLWVNRRALDLVGITRDTLNPKNGVIVRDPDSGEATGMLGGSAMKLVTGAIPEATLEELQAAVLLAISMAHAFGITSAIDPGMDHEQALAFRKLAEEARLSMRVLLALTPSSWNVEGFGDEIYAFLDARPEDTHPLLRSNSVKVFIDGAVEGATAALLEPYLGEFEHNVQPYDDPDTLARYFTHMDTVGINIHVHAIGDLGVRAALDGFEAMRMANGPSDNRHVMTHLQYVHPQDRGRFAELDITAGFSPLWARAGYYELNIYPPMVGEERAMQGYPMRSLLDSGTRIAGSSDWSVSSMNPLLAIETGITRQDAVSNSSPDFEPHERVDLETMIAAYTINVAWLMQNEQLTGSIEVGKKADLVALDRNLFEIPAYEISDAEVVFTVFDGKIVYQTQP